jgi:predicted acyl esterase
MKNNKEVIEYLIPYTTMKGEYLRTKVILDKETNLFETNLTVQIDIKSSWIGVANINNRDVTIKRFLKRNGFTYHSVDSTYRRPYSQYV